MSRQPHLVYLMADHLRTDVIGPYPSEYAKCPTPNIDAVARNATVFDHHITACPLCCPTRSSIMTGTWTHRHGAITNGGPTNRVRDGFEYLPHRLADAGYRVVHAGVQHVRTERFTAHPGVEFLPEPPKGIAHSGLDVRDFKSPTLIRRPDGSYRVIFNSNAQTARWPDGAGTFYDVALADQLVETIMRHDPNRPLALFGMFWAPHPPFVVPDPWWSQFPPDTPLALPPTVGVWCEGQSPLHLLHLPGHLGAAVPKQHWPRVWAAYFGLVAMLDACIGRVIDALKARGMYDDALVVITSDHGETLGAHALLQKMSMYEESVRVPFVAKFPGQERARRSGSLTNHVDVAPTLLALAGAEPLPAAVGVPLTPDGPAEERPYTFSEYHGNNAPDYHQWMVRSLRYKLIDTGPYGMELYDLQADPFEQRNLWPEPGHREACAELVQALSEFKSGYREA